MASRKLFGSLLALAALAIALNSAYAKDISKTETAYEGAPSGIDPTTAKNLITSEGPPMTVEEFNRSKTIFFERCAGCHGVLRKGATGKPLTTDITRSRGDAALKAFITYGSPAGMPNWGTSGDMTEQEIDMMARYLQHEPPTPPEWGMKEMKESWKVHIPVKDRPTKKMNDYNIDNIFSVTLRDAGQVALIDGDTKDIINVVNTGYAVHISRLSSSGRYLYVICRDGTLSMVDLYADPPARVASVRVGYEARTVGASRFAGYEDRYVLAGAYWPPQLILLDGQTLEPLRLISTRSFTAGGLRYHPEPRVTDVVGSPAHPEFISQIKDRDLENCI